MTGSEHFFQLVKDRRTNYALSKSIPVSDEKLQEIVETSTKHTPTAFNNQSSRTVLVLGEKNDRLWDVIFDRYKTTLGGDGEREKRNKKRFEEAYKSGYGTVVFFEDQTVIAQSMNNSPDYKHLFPIWAQNSAGMLQYVVWSAFQAEGIAANLQHYGQVGEEIENAIKSFLDIPSSWTSTALMPFGIATAPPGGSWPKTFKPIEDRVRIIQ